MHLYAYGDTQCAAQATVRIAQRRTDKAHQDIKYYVLKSTYHYVLLCTPYRTPEWCTLHARIRYIRVYVHIFYLRAGMFHHTLREIWDRNLKTETRRTPSNDYRTSYVGNTDTPRSMPAIPIIHYYILWEARSEIGIRETSVHQVYVDLRSVPEPTYHKINLRDKFEMWEIKREPPSRTE
jgi:hypothetical protein